MADAAVSVLVIIGLVAGRQFGWIWMDPLMGIIATAVILSWSWSLVRGAGAEAGEAHVGEAGQANYASLEQVSAEAREPDYTNDEP
jgi:Co/Zn/Cd efflux system component